MAPHRKMKNRLSGVCEGVSVHTRSPRATPARRNSTYEPFHTFTSLSIKKADARIRPKKKAHVAIGYAERQYSSSFASVNTLSRTPMARARRNQPSIFFQNSLRWPRKSSFQVSRLRTALSASIILE